MEAKVRKIGVEKTKKKEGVHLEVDDERVYITVKVTTDYTSIFCKKERWKNKNSTRLLIS